VRGFKAIGREAGRAGGCAFTVEGRPLNERPAVGPSLLVFLLPAPLLACTAKPHTSAAPTVSRLCAKTSSPLRARWRTASRSPLQHGSIRQAGKWRAGQLECG